MFGGKSGIEETRLKVDEQLARGIRGQARRLGVSSASLCHGAWAQVLSKICGRQDVVFGSVLSGRMQGGKGADRAMGLFMNTLPVRIQTGQEGAEASIRAVHQQLVKLLRHEHASLALAQRCSGVPASLPLFSALLNYRHSGGAGQSRSEAKMRVWDGVQGLFGEERTNYPVLLSIDDLGEGFWLKAQVDSSIDGKRVCRYMETALGSLVEALQESPLTPVCQLNVLPAEEREQLLYGWNETKREYRSNLCVHELFEEQVERAQEATALVFEEQELSYGELNRRANQVAHYLRRLGVKPDTRVAICVERGVEMIVGLLGILKAGGAYVPLDPAYPVERLSYSLRNAEAAVLITQNHLVAELPSYGGKVLCLDSEEARQRLDLESSENLKNPAASRQSGVCDLYLGVYGTAEGCGHRASECSGAAALVAGSFFRRELGGVLASTSICFDLSVFEIFAPLSWGGRVIVSGNALDLEGMKDAEREAGESRCLRRCVNWCG